MALTPSNMLPLGTHAPAFSLPDTVSVRPIPLVRQPVNALTWFCFCVITAHM
jgi:hypothetical protein